VLNNKLLGIVFAAIALPTFFTSKLLSQSSQPTRESQQLPVQLSQATASPSLAPAESPARTPDESPARTQSESPSTSPVRTQSESPTTNPSMSPTQGAISAQDRQFVMMAAQGGMAEVELGRLAGQKASISSVKNFGQQMVQEHTQANNQLKQLASRKSITLPTGVSEQHKATKAKLSKLSGAAFNQELMNQMVMDHEKTVALFERQSQQGSDPDLKAWATKTLPTLRGHLRTALSVQRNVAYKPSTK
jgi:putative membrane protein